MPMYDSYIMNLFNVIYTAFPPLVIGWTEKDITEQCALSNPEMYAEFRTSEQFTVFKFIRYICIGLVQASICFWIAFGIFYDIEVISSDGTTAGIYVFGQWIATSTILVINLSFLMMAHNWTGMLLGSAGIGILSYILTYVVFGYWISVDADLYGVAKYIFEPVTQYLYVLIALVLSLIVLRVTVINPNKGK
jgi:magnesium-transporting ATPase (P-type)